MKKTLLVLAAVLMASTMTAQTLWSEDFSQGIPSSWTMFDDGHTAHHENMRSGAWCASSTYGNPVPGVVSCSWFEPAGVADRWLITDSFQVPDSGYVFALDAACYEPAYPDGFMVKVSTTNRDSRDAFLTTIINCPAATGEFFEYRGSLDEFVGQTIYVAVIQNSNDMNFLIADNFKVYVPAANEVALMSVSMPANLAMGSNTPVNGVVKNLGAQPLTSFDVTYNVNGGADVAVYTVTGINVPFGSTYNFSHNVPFSESTPGNYTVTMTVSNPNGVEDPTPADNTQSATTAVYDPATVVPRTSILEQFTGAACGWCPGGHDRIEQALQGTNTIWAVHHAGFGNDALTCIANQQYTFFYNDGGSTYAPALMVDRFHGVADEPGPVTTVGDVPAIQQYVSTVNSNPCFLTLNIDGITYNADSRTFGGTVTGHFTTSSIYNENTRLTLMVVEDSNIMAQTDYSTGSTQTLPNYMHFKAVRATLTDVWGDAISVDANGDFTYNVNATLPNNLKAWRCRVIAIVSDRNANDANACSVMQAATTENLNAPYVGISEANEVSLNAYPNPATDYLTIEAGSNIREVSIYNVMGQKVYGSNNVNGELFVVDTKDMASGMYMVTIRTDKGVASQRFSVVR
jgi:hypothetical protein